MMADFIYLFFFFFTNYEYINPVPPTYALQVLIGQSSQPAAKGGVSSMWEDWTQNRNCQASKILTSELTCLNKCSIRGEKKTLLDEHNTRIPGRCFQ